MTAAGHYPVFLDLRGRECVVLGSTADRRREGRGTARCRRDRHPPSARVPGRRPRRCVPRGGRERGRPFAHRGARAEAHRERVLLNVVDVAYACDWIAPAVVHRGPLQIAISTSGESPFLAATVRQRLERTIGAEWGPFTTLMGRLRRRLRTHGVAMEAQQRAYRRCCVPTRCSCSPSRRRPPRR